MIKALVFDCFGVLAEDGWQKLDRLYLKDDFLRQRAHDLNKQSDLGMITYHELFLRLAELIDGDYEEIKRTLESEQKDERMFDLIKQYKSDYKIGLLSNVGKSFMDNFLDESEVKLFDAMVLSSSVGFIKPDPRAYAEIAKRLGVTTAECVMIDDRNANCEGAKVVGMEAILYEEFHSFSDQLVKLLA